MVPSIDSTGGTGGVSSSGYSYYPDVVIPGIGIIPVDVREATSPKLVEEYYAILKRIKDIVDKGGYRGEDVIALKAALEDLAKLAKEGDQTKNPPCYFIPSLTDGLQVVFSILNGVGFTPGKDISLAMGLDALYQLNALQMKDGKGNTIKFSDIISEAMKPIGADKPLQTMLYYDFVLFANKVLDDKLKDLADQLELTQKVAELLTRIQNLRNRMLGIPQSPDWDSSNPPAVIIPKVGDITRDLYTELMGLQEELKARIEDLKKQGVDPNDPGSLAHALQKLVDTFAPINDFGPNPPFDDPALKFLWPHMQQVIHDWLIDSRATPGKSGVVQDALSQAMAAATALNDTQKNELREVQLVYEQFIKIANEVMQSIHKMMQAIAQGIGR